MRTHVSRAAWPIRLALVPLALLAVALFGDPAVAFPSHVSGSYYHSKFEGRTMACGGRFDNEGLTAASNHHPCGAKVRVAYRDREVVVRITDRCGRCGIDLTRAAARELGMLSVGRATVRVERLTGIELAGYAAPSAFEEAAYVPPAGFGDPLQGDAAASPRDPAAADVVAEATPAAAPLVAAAEPAVPAHVGAVPLAARGAEGGDQDLAWPRPE